MNVSRAHFNIWSWGSGIPEASTNLQHSQCNFSSCVLIFLSLAAFFCHFGFLGLWERCFTHFIEWLLAFWFVSSSRSVSFKFCSSFPNYCIHNPIFALIVIIATTPPTSFVVLLFNLLLHLFWLHASIFTRICTKLHSNIQICSFSCCPWVDLGFLGLDLALPCMHYAFMFLKTLPWLQELCRGSQ